VDERLVHILVQQRHVRRTVGALLFVPESDRVEHLMQQAVDAASRVAADRLRTSNLADI